MPQLSSKVNFFTDSVIRRMTRIAQQYNAVNLSQGFPDFDPPQALKDSLAQVALSSVHQYAITWGAQNFRDALAKKQSHFMGLPINPQTNIVVTCGSTEAMMAAMMTVINPGDKVIIFSPFYENYTADTILTGAQPIYVHLKTPDFSIDYNQLEEAFKQNPKAIIVCNPSNPSGKVFTKDELEHIAFLSKKYDTFVITDEVYEHIVYTPNSHTYMASLPGMFERTISCSSLSKTYSITGWRLGYIIAPEHIIDAARKIHDFLTVGAAAPLQEAAVTALNFNDEYYKELLDVYTQKRDFFLNGLQNLDFTFFKPQGAYYVLTDISEYGVKNDVAFCEWMAREVGVATVPGSSFFRNNSTQYIRFHYAKSIDYLSLALDKLSSFKQKIKTYKE